MVRSKSDDSHLPTRIGVTRLNLSRSTVDLRFPTRLQPRATEDDRAAHHTRQRTAGANPTRRLMPHFDSEEKYAGEDATNNMERFLTCKRLRRTLPTEESGSTAEQGFRRRNSAVLSRCSTRCGPKHPRRAPRGVLRVFPEAPTAEKARIACGGRG